MFHNLCRQEFEAALNADRIVAAGQEASRTKLPQVSSLSIALASSIPFVGMGAVDNAIMVSLLHEYMHADRYRAYHLQALEASYLPCSFCSSSITQVLASRHKEGHCFCI